MHYALPLPVPPRYCTGKVITYILLFAIICWKDWGCAFPSEDLRHLSLKH